MTALGEVFFGPPGECVIGLEWYFGEPTEDIVLSIIGELEERLSDWRLWSQLDECDLINVLRIHQTKIG